MTFKEFKQNYQQKEVNEISFSPFHNPVASVLVQTYQQKKYIKECLESILMQKTNFDFEILIGEDGSIDGTREICLELVKKYPEKIRLFLHHRINQIKIMGESTSNFNAFYNFFSARGKYIAFCEGDDKWSDPLKLQKQVDFLKSHGEYSFCYHEFKTINEHGDLSPELLELEQPKFDLSKKELLEVKFHALLQTICFKKEAGEIPSEMTEVLNVDTFFFSFLGNYGKAKYLGEIDPSFYRRHPGGIWSERAQEKKLFSKILTYSKLREYYIQNKELQQYFNLRIKQVNRSLWIYYMNQGEISKTFQLVGKIF